MKHPRFENVLVVFRKVSRHFKPLFAAARDIAALQEVCRNANASATPRYVHLLFVSKKMGVFSYQRAIVPPPFWDWNGWPSFADARLMTAQNSARVVASTIRG